MPYNRISFYHRDKVCYRLCLWFKLSYLLALVMIDIALDDVPVLILDVLQALE
jgi:hypothetical protein